MAKKGKEKEKSQGQQAVKIETMIIVTLIALVLGFFAGELINFSRSDRTAPVQTPPMPQPPLPAAAPTADQAKTILTLEQEASANPGNAETWTQLGNVYYDSNQFEQAIRAYKKSLEMSPYDANVWTDLGVMYRRNKQPFEAVGAFNKAIDVDPRHEISRMNKGIVLLHDLDDPKGAIEAWEGLLKVNPSAKLGNGQLVSDIVEKLKQAPDQ